MLDVIETDTFKAWVKGLKDSKAKAAIGARLIRLRHGLFGDVKPVGEGVSELRINQGPGYRIYFTERKSKLIILLSGGDKSSQDRDIQKAKAMAGSL